MKFDLTKNVVLKPSWQKRYFFARLVLLVLFIAVGIYFFYRVFFPTRDFFINFSNLKDKENNLEINDAQTDKIILNAYSSEKFSDTKVQISSKEDFPDASGNIVMIRKTYQAFAYPAAPVPASFPEGSLEKNNGQYYIVSGGKLRRFQSPAIATALGYQKDAFEEATAEELRFNETGSNIVDVKSFSDGTLFLIDGIYYQMKNQVLNPFVSEKAYLSRYEKNQALAKDKGFLKNYAVSEDVIGFADGTLLSFDIGVFVVVSGKVMPFNNPATFLSFGYNWDDIIPASEEEVGLYGRDKLFSSDRPHPDGTVFFASDLGKYYLISSGQKYEIKGAEILRKYLKKNPITVQEKSLDFQNYCQLKKTWWPLNSCRCSASIKNLAEFFGNNYQFETQKSPGLTLAEAEIKFYRNLNWENMRDILAEIKLKFLANYGYSPK
ncbi:MAG: hypothetical protein WC608_01180 [Parcubacteria group bacterium]